MWRRSNPTPPPQNGASSAGRTKTIDDADTVADSRFHRSTTDSSRRRHSRLIQQNIHTIISNINNNDPHDRITFAYFLEFATSAQQTGVSLVSASAAAFSCELLKRKTISCSAIANCQRINLALFGALSVK